MSLLTIIFREHSRGLNLIYLITADKEYLEIFKVLGGLEMRKQM
jgi:hypothetical protein